MDIRTSGHSKTDIMNIWLKIYLYGCLASLVVAVLSCRDKDGKIDWIDFGISAALSLASWSAFLGLGVGYLLKRK